MNRLLLTAAVALTPGLLSAQNSPSPPSIVPAPASTLLLKHAPRPTKGEISAQDLMTRLYIFADDSMMGRSTGTEGNVKGTTYIASEVKRFGLVPAGDNGTFFQTIPFMTRTVDSTSRLVAAGAALGFGAEWVASGNSPASLAGLEVIYGGAVGADPVPLTVEQAKGKLVILSMPAGANPRGIRGLARSAPGAALIGVVVPEQAMAGFAQPASFLDNGTRVPPTLFMSAAGAAKLFEAPVDQTTPGAAGKTVTLDYKVIVKPVQYPARNVVAILPGSDPALKGQYVAIGAHNDHVGFSTRPVDHDSLRIYNHLVRPGGAEDGGKQATPAQQTEINTQLAAWRTAHPGASRPDSIFNGADDDGSGSMSVLELAEKLASLPASRRPKRSVIFVWHVGEERGLWGAQHFTDHPTVPRDSIVAQLNMDMVGRGNAWDVTGLSKDGAILRGGPDYVQLVGSRRLSTELGDIVEAANTGGKHGFVFDYGMDANGHPMNIYCRSDHYEYARYGIPIVFFTTGGHSDYHQVTDEPQYIDYGRMERVVKLLEDITTRVANLDHRIVVDQPKPDPNGRCVQ